MSAPTSAEMFAQSVAATLDAAHHLFAQVDRLNIALLESLLSEPTPFSFLGGTPLDANDRTDRIERRIRGQYHFLLDADGDGANESDEGDDEEDNDSEVSPTRRSRIARKRGKAQIRANDPYLALGVILHGRLGGEVIETPHVRAFILKDWKLGNPATKPKGDVFGMVNHMMIRMLRSLDVDPSMDLSRRLGTEARAYLSGTKDSQSTVSVQLAAPPIVRPLIEIASMEAVEALVDQIKAQWRTVTGIKP